MKYPTAEELPHCLEKAMPIERRIGGKQKIGEDLREIGYIQKWNTCYRMFMDQDGNYWYQTLIETEHGLVDEKEYYRREYFRKNRRRRA